MYARPLATCSARSVVNRAVDPDNRKTIIIAYRVSMQSRPEHVRVGDSGWHPELACLSSTITPVGGFGFPRSETWGNGILLPGTVSLCDIVYMHWTIDIARSDAANARRAQWPLRRSRPFGIGVWCGDGSTSSCSNPWRCLPFAHVRLYFSTVGRYPRTWSSTSFLSVKINSELKHPRRRNSHDNVH